MKCIFYSFAPGGQKFSQLTNSRSHSTIQNSNAGSKNTPTKDEQRSTRRPMKTVSIFPGVSYDTCWALKGSSRSSNDQHGLWVPLHILFRKCLTELTTFTFQQSKLDNDDHIGNLRHVMSQFIVLKLTFCHMAVRETGTEKQGNGGS